MKIIGSSLEKSLDQSKTGFLIDGPILSILHFKLNKYFQSIQKHEKNLLNWIH